MRRSDQLVAEQAALDNWEQQEAAGIAGERADFNRAYSVCLQGRGYSVM
jgi:hypothetical protein